MSDDILDLIPRPPEMRERLARHMREGRLLRALYRLSIRAAEERQRTDERGDVGVDNGARISS